VGSFIGGFKASVTARAARELYMTGIWQRNYYERIIRNDRELESIWKYIDANPTNWEADEENRLC
jgi:transposase-like protein